MAADTNGPYSSAVNGIPVTENDGPPPDGCASCQQLKEEVNGYKKEHAFYSDLKKKISLTDALIRRYSTKCQEFDLQQKKIEELTHKLASSKRDCKLLEDQLAKTLKEIIPWKREKSKFMDEYENNKRKLSTAQDALVASQVGGQQYRIQMNEMEKTISLLKKESSDSKIKLRNLDKKKFNMEDFKTQTTKLRQEKRVTAVKLEKAQSIILKLRGIFVQHNLRIPRYVKYILPGGIVGSSSQVLDDDDDYSDVSMESVEDKDPAEDKPSGSEPYKMKPDPYGRKVADIQGRKDEADKLLSSTSRGRNTVIPKENHESSSDDNISGAEIMSTFADEIEAQLNLLDSEEEDSKESSIKSSGRLGCAPETSSKQSKMCRTSGGGKDENSRVKSLRTKGKSKMRSDNSAKERQESSGDAKEWASPATTAAKSAREKIQQSWAMQPMQEIKSPDRKTGSLSGKQVQGRGHPRQLVRSVADKKKSTSGEDVKKSSAVAEKKSRSEGVKKNTKSIDEKKCKTVDDDTKKHSSLQMPTDTLTSSESDSSEDNDVQETVASRTRTRTQSQSKSDISLSKGKVGTARIKTSQNLSKPDKAVQNQSKSDKGRQDQSRLDKGRQDQSKPDRTRHSKPRFTKTGTKRQSRMERKSNERRPISKEILSSDIESSDEDAMVSRCSPPRTRSHSRSGQSGAEKTPTNKSKVLVKKRRKEDLSLSDSSCDDLSRGRARVPQTKRLPIKLDKVSESKNKTRVSLSDTSDDDWHPTPREISTYRKEASDEMASDSQQPKPKSIQNDPLVKFANSTSTNIPARQRRNTDSEFELNRYPRRRLPRRRCQNKGDADVDAELRKFYSDGDKPLDMKHGRIFDSEDVVDKIRYNRARKLHASSEDESGEEQSKCLEDSQSGALADGIADKMKEENMTYAGGKCDRDVPSEVGLVQENEAKIDSEIGNCAFESQNKVDSGDGNHATDCGIGNHGTKNLETDSGIVNRAKDSGIVNHATDPGNVNSATYYSGFENRAVDSGSVNHETGSRIVNSGTDTGIVNCATDSGIENCVTEYAIVDHTTDSGIVKRATDSEKYSHAKGNNRDVSNQERPSGTETRVQSSPRSQKSPESSSKPMQSKQDSGTTASANAPKQKLAINAKNLMLTNDNSVFSKKFLKPISPVRSSPRIRGKIPSTGTRANPFFPERLTRNSIQNLSAVFAKRGCSSTSDDSGHDQTGNDADAPVSVEHNLSVSTAKASNVEASNAELMSGRKTRSNSTSSDQEADEVDKKKEGGDKVDIKKVGHDEVDKKKEREDKVDTKKGSNDKLDAKKADSATNNDKQISGRGLVVDAQTDRKRDGGNGLPKQLETPCTSKRVTSSGNHPGSKASGRTVAEDDTERLKKPNATGSEKKSSSNTKEEDVHFASPMPTKDFYSRRRTRSTSTASSCSDASNLSDTLDQNDVQEDSERNNSMPQTRRRTRSMMTRSCEKQPMRVTRSTSEPGSCGNEKVAKDSTGLSATIISKSEITPGKRMTRLRAVSAKSDGLSSKQTESGAESSISVEDTCSSIGKANGKGHGTDLKRVRTRLQSKESGGSKDGDGGVVKKQRRVGLRGRADSVSNDDGSDDGGLQKKQRRVDLRGRADSVSNDDGSDDGKEEDDVVKMQQNVDLDNEDGGGDGKDKVIQKQPGDDFKDSIDSLDKDEDPHNDEKVEDGDDDHDDKDEAMKNQKKHDLGSKNNEDNEVNKMQEGEFSDVQEKNRDDPIETHALEHRPSTVNQSNNPVLVDSLEMQESGEAVSPAGSSLQASESNSSANNIEPSPGSGLSNLPNLAPLLDIVPRGHVRLSQLAEIFDEGNASRQLSPVSPLLEPFQNFDGERSISPLPMSPSESPPLMERPLSALSLPDIPPLPPLVTPLPPSPLRPGMMRSVRLPSHVRMISPLITPPPVPRAISPLPNPPMPAAISPLKEESEDIESGPVDARQSPHGLNLIPSPRNFHAIAPRHALAVPPHKMGLMFQAARCLTENFEEDERDIPGPSGFHNLNFNESAPRRISPSNAMDVTPGGNDNIDIHNPDRGTRSDKKDPTDDITKRVQSQDAAQRNHFVHAFKKPVSRKSSVGKVTNRSVVTMATSGGIDEPKDTKANNEGVDEFDSTREGSSSHEAQTDNVSGSKGMENESKRDDSVSGQGARTDSMLDCKGLENDSKSGDICTDKEQLSTIDCNKTDKHLQKSIESGNIDKNIKSENSVKDTTPGGLEVMDKGAGEIKHGGPKLTSQQADESICGTDDNVNSKGNEDDNDGASLQNINEEDEDDVSMEKRKRGRPKSVSRQAKKKKSTVDNGNSSNANVEEKHEAKDSGHLDKDELVGDTGKRKRGRPKSKDRPAKKKTPSGNDGVKPNNGGDGSSDPLVEGKEAMLTRTRGKTPTEVTMDADAVPIKRSRSTRSVTAKEKKLMTTGKQSRQYPEPVYAKLGRNEVGRRIAHQSGRQRGVIAKGVWNQENTAESKDKHVVDNADEGSGRRSTPGVKSNEGIVSRRPRRGAKPDLPDALSMTSHDEKADPLGTSSKTSHKKAGLPFSSSKTSREKADPLGSSSKTSLKKGSVPVSSSKTSHFKANSLGTPSKMVQEKSDRLDTSTATSRKTNENNKSENAIKKQANESSSKSAVQHKVTSKPCSNLMASSKRIAIMIPAAEIKVTGFKRSGSIQKKRLTGQDKASSQTVGSPLSPPSLATPVAFIKSTCPAEAPCTPSPAVANFVIPPLATSNHPLSSGDVAMETKDTGSSTSSIAHHAVEDPCAGVLPLTTSHATAAIKSQASNHQAPKNLPTGPSSEGGQSEMPNTSATHGLGCDDSNEIIQKTSHTVPSKPEPNIVNTSSSGQSPGVVATARKPRSKMGNLWGNIAKEQNQVEKNMLQKAAEVKGALINSKDYRLNAKTDGDIIRPNAKTDGNTGTGSNRQLLEGVRTSAGTAPTQKNVASSWGTMATTGMDQQEVCRRRKKVSVVDKMITKQQKLLNNPDMSTSQPAATKMNNTAAAGPNEKNETHYQQTLDMIKAYEMGTRAAYLVNRIVSNFQHNAIDLLPVVFARCASGNTSTQPVMTPKEEKMITALMEWTKKNDCTTLVDLLLPRLRQSMDFVQAIIPVNRKGCKKIRFAIYSTYCRMHTILCLRTNNIQCARVFAYEIVHSNYQGFAGLVLSIASSWPAVLCKQETVEACPVGSVLEVVIMRRLTKSTNNDAEENQLQLKTISSLRSICSWEPHQPDTVANLTKTLTDMIPDDNIAQFINESDPNPTLGQMSFELIKAMELLAFCMGWEWSNDTLIREHLWPILKKWSTSLNSENGIKNASACVVMKIIAHVGVKGLAKNKQSVAEVMKMLQAVLQQPSNIIPQCVQLFTADAILQLSAAKPSQSCPVLQHWCSNTDKDIPPSFTERIKVLTNWVSNKDPRQSESNK